MMPATIQILEEANNEWTEAAMGTNYNPLN